MPNATPNKVKYGLKNVHYALLTVDENGAATYGKPTRIPGAVNLTMDAQGEANTFYADDMAYFVTETNDGYSGTLEVALIPDSFRTDVLNEALDENDQVLTENVNAATVPFALLFEFNGDQRAIRHVLYNCTCGRTSVSGATTTNTSEPTTETMNLTAAPLANGNTKTRTTTNTPAISYNGWYDSVWQPLGKLTVESVAGAISGTTKLTVAPALNGENTYKTKTGETVVLPSYGENLGSDWAAWDGIEDVTATNGQQIAVVEVDPDGNAVAGGVTSVVANAG